jgi:hypothetical protein
VSLEAGKNLKETRNFARKALLAPLLLALLLPQQLLALAQPVTVQIVYRRPEWGKPFSYGVRIDAKESTDVVVWANVYVPGRGWSGFRELWRGHLSAGEGAWVDGMDSREPVESGYYVVWIRVYFYNFLKNFEVIDGKTYYADYDDVLVVEQLVKEAQKEHEELKQEYKELKQRYDSLMDSYDRLLASYQKLQSENRGLISALDALALFLVIAAALAFEGWRRALSYAKKARPAGGG